jgi:hypothetical protein
MAAYTGALARAAYYSTDNAPPGATPDHGLNVAGQDVFVPPHPDAEVNAGVVWADEYEPAPMGDGPSLPTSHTGVRAVPVPMGTPEWRLAYTGGMIEAHSHVEYIADARAHYTPATKGMVYEHSPDEGPRDSGVTGPDWFMVGRNAYDTSNPVNAMNSETGGRYRLGRRQVILGEYDQPGKYGQDAELRATQFRAPYLPQDTPPVPNPTGRTRSSSGTTTWTLPSFNVPQLYSTPQKEAATDVALSTAPAYAEYGTGEGEFQ